MDLSALILLFFAKVKNKLFRPKGPAPLNDQSFRQTNIFSKVQQTVVINVPGKDQYWIGNLESLPENAKKALRENFSDERKPSDLPVIRCIRNDFQNDVTEYERFFESDSEVLNKILPYLRPDYASILKLSSFVKSKYDSGKQADADQIKNHIGEQYGKTGRRLCNLYTSGYISAAISAYMAEYVDQKAPSKTDTTEICKALNVLISTVIDFSENIYFIHPGSDPAIIKTRIINAMKSKKPYIALHSAGSINIAIAEEIIRGIGRDNIDSMGYEITQGSDRIPSTVPFFDVRITPKESH